MLGFIVLEILPWFGPHRAQILIHCGPHWVHCSALFWAQLGLNLLLNALRFGHNARLVLGLIGPQLRPYVAEVGPYCVPYLVHILVCLGPLLGPNAGILGTYCIIGPYWA